MPKDFPNPTRHKKKRGSLTLSLVPRCEALAFAHPVKNEQRTETHADDYIMIPYDNHCGISICHIWRRIGSL